jgi:hypothetical protein
MAASRRLALAALQHNSARISSIQRRSSLPLAALQHNSASISSIQRHSSLPHALASPPVLRPCAQVVPLLELMTSSALNPESEAAQLNECR